MTQTDTTSVGASVSKPSNADVFTSLSTGAILFTLTVGLMVLLADTIVASVVVSLYAITPILGVAVMGGLLMAGQYFAKSGFQSDQLSKASMGCLVSMFAYGAFGAAVYQIYNHQYVFEATVISFVITALISLIAGLYVYKSGKNFSSWEAKSGGFFVAGIVSILIGSVVEFAGITLLTGLLIGVGFILFLVGFTVLLVYEIWQVLSVNNNPVKNGFGLYIAFTGVYVHVLQIVLSYLAGQD